jgi:hypothetical protein
VHKDDVLLSLYDVEIGKLDCYFFLEDKKLVFSSTSSSKILPEIIRPRAITVFRLSDA